MIRGVERLREPGGWDRPRSGVLRVSSAPGPRQSPPVVNPTPIRPRPLALFALLVGGAVASTAGCTIVREAPFRGASERVTDATLRGPFDGRIVDANTGEPIADAVVVAVWNFDDGDGLLGPGGAETRRVQTDPAGRYRIAPVSMRPDGPRPRLVSFSLSVYKRGYAGYRSDRTRDGEPRQDFTVRHNTVALEKWSESDSHAEHLSFLTPARPLAPALAWERDKANMDLYRELGGQMQAPTWPGDTAGVDPSVDPDGAGGEVQGGGTGGDPDSVGDGPKLLDATGMMSPTELQMRTGDEGAFEVGDLGDLPHTEFYQGVHFQAVDRGEEYDVAYRVWNNPPGGLDPVVSRFVATFPDVPITDDVTEQTWVLDAPDIRAVAFVDKRANAGLLLTCGPAQCTDIETAIILAKFLRKNLDKVRTVAAPDPDLEPQSDPEPVPAPTPEPEPASEAAEASSPAPKGAAK